MPITNIIETLNRDSDNRPICMATCHCGKGFTAQCRKLSTKQTKSCGCLKYSGLTRGHSFSYNSTNKKTLSRVYSSYKHSAKVRNLELSIDKENFGELASQECFYCKEVPETYHGLDRIDPQFGYVIDNVVPCCKKCNLMKHTLTQQEFVKHITKIYQALVKPGELGESPCEG